MATKTMVHARSAMPMNKKKNDNNSRTHTSDDKMQPRTCMEKDNTPPK